jgi:acyl carrier protein
MELKEQIRQFILTNFYVADPDSLADDTSLLDLAIIDSTGVLEVITFLESEYGISIDDAEIVPENLETISRIAAFVAQKRAAAAA